jgi:hypothetical protein
MLAIAATLLLYLQRRWSSRVLRKREWKSQGRAKLPRSPMCLRRVVVIAVALAIDVESEGWANAALEGQC